MEKKDLNLIKDFYKNYSSKIADIKKILNRSLTLTEKILFAHIENFPKFLPRRSVDTLNFLPDRVAMQDATAQTAMLQFMVTGLDTVKVPSTIHCDHLIRAKEGSKKDLLKAFDENEEVYEFLRTAAARYGIGFWKPGSGIIHQVVLEQYAFPGGMMIGTDSHTPNAGGLAMIAIGVGGADAVDVMSGQPWELLNPKVIGVHLKGKLSGWTAPKDVILKVAGELTVKGGTGAIIEYFGEGTKSISCTGKGTITNMGAELGATTSIFPYDQKMSSYLRATERSEIANLADKLNTDLNADSQVLQDPEKYYDQVLEIDLSKLESQWVGPHTPDLLRKVSEMKQAVKENNYPNNIRVALIGSCTNSSYEDISRAASIAKQAKDCGVKAKIPFLVTPGSDQIFQTIARDGFLTLFEDVGGTVLANACGPCIGQWDREDIKPGEQNVIVTSYNRNFKKRNDGNAETMAFIGSPELVTAMAFSGKLDFDPINDSLETKEKSKFKFGTPTGSELPTKGFVFSKEGYLAPIEDLDKRKKLTVSINPNSDRLAKLERFKAWEGTDLKDLVLLVKAKGKCTTDHISQAGPWLKYRGHLANISKNLFLGAVNAFSDQAGVGTNVITGEKNISFPDLAAEYKKLGQEWIAVGDENYGEGSSREHAAMEPRFMGCRTVIAKSFARIAETNLKKQGVLPLIFKNSQDYDLILENARYDLIGVTELMPSSKLKLRIKSAAGEKEIELLHTLTETQIKWFKAGSALNSFKM